MLDRSNGGVEWMRGYDLVGRSEFIVRYLRLIDYAPHEKWRRAP